MSKKLLNLSMTVLLSVVSTAAWALTEEGGFYQIGSAEDYAEFAALVNGGQKNANAILTADIDLGTDIDTYKIYNGEYVGVFDGAGHTITINFADGTKDNQGPALFRSIGRYAIVKRLKVQGSLTTARQHAAGIANYSGGIIRDCWADLTITCSQEMADASAAALIGQCNMHSVTENCLAKVAIDAPGSHKFGGVAAWSDAERTHFANNLVLNDNADFDWSDGKSAGLVRNDANLAIVDLNTYNENSYKNWPKGAVANNYVIDDWGVLNKGTEVVTTADVASGKVCFMLNSDQSDIRWTQNLETDPYPVPAVFREGGKVYASAATNCQGKADGEVTFSNTASNTVATAHTYDKYGVCTTCGQFNWNYFDLDDPEKFDLSKRAFVINEGKDFFVVETWNRFHNGLKYSIELAKDVECKPDPGQLIFNSTGWIEGGLYGQNHTLTIEMVDIEEDYAALFPKWYNTAGGAVMENFVLHGTIGTSARNAGSLIGRDYGTDNKVRNVFSDVTINTTHTGDCSHGGFINCGGTRTTFDNCIYAGNINGVDGSEAVGGFCGWANGTNYFNNCAFLGSLNNFIGDTHTLSRNVGSARFSNVYSVYDYNGTDADKYTAVTAEAVASGELAFRLNGEQEGFDRFYQLIGTDPEPMPIKKEGALVYTNASEYRCDGKPMGTINYANTPSAIVPSHQFDEGICTVCGDTQDDYMTPVDGWYEVGSAAQLMWWAHYAAKKNLGASVRLTADIDMEPYNETYPDRHYPQIGNETTPFYGNFDGQFHTISNLVINLPGKRGAGLIGVMSSQPSNGYGGLSEEAARAAEGVFVKNVVLENSSILGQGYTGVVGMAANWAGHITISGVLNMGEATVDGGTNGAGLFGCCMGSKSYMTIENCGFIGKIHVLNDTHTENGLFSGWLGQYADVTNCFALGTIDAYPDPARSWARHPNYNTVVIKNCYALEGSGIVENSYSNTPEVTFIPEEEIKSGALAWKANGGQFRNPAWYQTLSVDDNPTPIPTHGTVISSAEQYFSALNDADIEEIAPVIQSYEEEKAEEDIIATQTLLDEWKELAEALGEATTISGLADAFEALDSIKVAVQENAAVYQAYIDKCTEVKTFLENDQTFSGSLRTALEAYLSEESEPDEDNPLGTYAYIIENHTATAEEIQAETARVAEWLTKAIAEDYVPGTDISWLIPNSDFAKKNTEHWTGAWCNAYGTVKDGNGKDVVGVEAWNRTGNMYQTVEGMKPGYYLVGVSGAFRPSNDRYSMNYSAGIYANGIFNYFPTVVEDYIAAKDTIDQVNCNLHGQGALDLAIYDDMFSTSEEQAADKGATLLGFAVHGPYGMAAAANAGRYQAYTIAYVGEDGKLTIGIKSQGTKYGNDWAGWGPIKVTYFGEEADDAIGTVFENMKARAQSIIAYESDVDAEDPAASPNFPAELRDSLQEIIDAFDVVDTSDAAMAVKAKVALLQRFSSIFQKVYEGKHAYIDLFKYAFTIQSIENGNLPLVEKDAEGQWNETGEMVFSEEEADAVFDASQAMLDAYREGTYSTEEALNPVTALEGIQAEAVATIVPEKDAEGYYLISNPKQFVAYRGLVNLKDNTLKAKLANDVDMAGIGMQPFTPDKVFSGTFDGQGNALENVTITHYGEMHTALFFELQNATVKNLKLTGEYYSDCQRMGGLTAWTSGTTKIENCEIAVALYSDKEGDGTHGGVMAVHGRGGNCTVNNCIVACKFIGEKTFSVGGVCGWRDATLNVKNTLILSEYDLAAEPASYATAIVSRNGYTDGGNVFYAASAKREGCIDQATLAKDEQLASGEICYKLNGDQSVINWWQTLGEDELPRLFGDHKQVFYDADRGYYNEGDFAKGDLNGDGKVDIADAVTVLNIMAAGDYVAEADINGDQKVDIADFVSILNIMAAQ